MNDSPCGQVCLCYAYRICSASGKPGKPLAGRTAWPAFRASAEPRFSQTVRLFIVFRNLPLLREGESPTFLLQPDNKNTRKKESY